jgi:fructose-1,6-bisphosphatase/inositol monophosphatase family enzyme
MADFLLGLGAALRTSALAFLEDHGTETRTAIARAGLSDVIYRLDQAVEERLATALEEGAAALGGVALVAEGVGEDDRTVWPRGRREEEAAWRILVDPVDGTRGLMHLKRSAFFLAGAAPNRDREMRLRDLQVAALVELPTPRARLADAFCAVRGQGVRGETLDLATGARRPLAATPHPGPTLRGGFAHLARFFPPGKGLLAQLEEDLLHTLFPEARPGEILAFDDQYIASGGQLYELLTGKDRFVADLRATLHRSAAFGDRPAGHACHPYDLAAHLLAEEAGCPLTDAAGDPLDGPLDTTTPLDWIGYANPALRAEVEPVLRPLVRQRLAPRV